MPPESPSGLSPPSYPSLRRLRTISCCLPLSLLYKIHVAASPAFFLPPPLPPLPPSCPAPRHLSIHDGAGSGLAITGAGTKGRLEDCEVWGNSICGLYVMEEGDPTLARCTVRDHAGRGDEECIGCGVFVAESSRGMAAVGADCIFTRNAGGDVVGPTR